MPEENKSQVTGNDITESQRLILDQMGGMEMAAVLMLSLNEEDAAQIFRHLEPKQVQRLGMSMASMSDFSHDRVAAVHRQFIDDIQKYTNIGIGSEDFVRKALVAALGRTRPATWWIRSSWGQVPAASTPSSGWMPARWPASSRTSTRRSRPSSSPIWSRNSRPRS
jgi:flagellar motor switch protein FliG